MIYVVMKHFPCNDLPVFASRNMAEAYVQAGAFSVDIGKLATEYDESIPPCDIGLPCVSIAVVTFDESGRAVKSEVVAA